MRNGRLFRAVKVRRKSASLAAEFYIIGLGNPGAQYSHTRHNAGFDVVSILSQRHKIPVRIHEYKARLGTGMIKDKKVTLCMPQTYINNSGESVKEVAQALKAGAEQIIVVYDDVDLPLGTVRIRDRGSAGTHNGLKSVIYHIQTDGFARVRVGIGKPEGEIVDHVLGEHSDKEAAFASLMRAADAVETIIGEGVLEAQSRFN